MEIDSSKLYDIFVKNFSVGSALQNILFYALLFGMAYLVNYLIKHNGEISRINRRNYSKGPNFGQLDINKLTQFDWETLIKNNMALSADVAILKKDVLELGKELELAYIKADRLNDQISDIINCLDLTMDYNDDLWRWSLNFSSNEISLSEFGLRVHNLPQNKKMLLADYLITIEDVYHSEIKKAIADCYEQGSDLLIEYKLKPSDSSTGRNIKLKALVIKNENLPEAVTGRFAFIQNKVSIK